MTEKKNTRECEGCKHLYYRTIEEGVRAPMCAVVHKSIVYMDNCPLSVNKKKKGGGIE